MEIFKFFTQTPTSTIEIIGSVFVGIIFLGYLVVWLAKNFPKFLYNSIFKTTIIDKQNHLEAADYRKKVIPKIRGILSNLVEEIEADRALLLEYSNGSSNLVGLPFLYITATVEVLNHNIHSVINQYQKTNVSIVSDVIEKIEDDTFLFIRDLETIKYEYPVIYTLLHKNGVKSVLFYALYSDNATIGFVVVTSVRNYLERKEILPKVATEAQAISSLLNYDKLKEVLK